MYIYIYMHKCVYIYIYKDVYILCVCIYLYMYVCVYIYIYICILVPGGCDGGPSPNDSCRASESSAPARQVLGPMGTQSPVFFLPAVLVNV